MASPEQSTSRVRLRDGESSGEEQSEETGLGFGGPVIADGEVLWPSEEDDEDDDEADGEQEYEDSEDEDVLAHPDFDPPKPIRRARHSDLDEAASVPLPPSPTTPFHVLTPTDSSSIADVDDDGEEPPTCRVCRSDDTAIGPLFHPCRCTGSIAHVHQDCLSTWLEHSRKSSCELCGHKFSFENVYKDGAPARPPVRTILKEAAKEVINALQWALRGLLVALAWLAVVPLAVKLINTNGLRAGDWTVRSFVLALPNADWPGTWNLTSTPSNGTLLGPPASSRSLNPAALSSTRRNVSGFVAIANMLASDPFFGSEATISNISAPVNTARAPARSFSDVLALGTAEAMAEYFVDVLFIDIVQGQLLTCGIIIAFVVIFLLREYIIQNTPIEALAALGLAADPFAAGVEGAAPAQQRQDVQGDPVGDAPGGLPPAAGPDGVGALVDLDHRAPQVPPSDRFPATSYRGPLPPIVPKTPAASAEGASSTAVLSDLQIMTVFFDTMGLIIRIATGDAPEDYSVHQIRQDLDGPPGNAASQAAVQVTKGLRQPWEGVKVLRLATSIEPLCSILREYLNDHTYEVLKARRRLATTILTFRGGPPDADDVPAFKQALGVACGITLSGFLYPGSIVEEMSRSDVRLLTAIYALHDVVRRNAGGEIAPDNAFWVSLGSQDGRPLEDIIEAFERIEEEMARALVESNTLMTLVRCAEFHDQTKSYLRDPSASYTLFVEDPETQLHIHTALAALQDGSDPATLASTRQAPFTPSHRSIPPAQPPSSELNFPTPSSSHEQSPADLAPPSGAFAFLNAENALPQPAPAPMSDDPEPQDIPLALGPRESQANEHVDATEQEEPAADLGDAAQIADAANAAPVDAGNLAIAPLDGAEPLEEGELVLEDLDGLLEAIGLQGPVLALLQNVGLVIVLLGGALVMFVHFPHFVGKTVVLFRADAAVVAPFRGLVVLRDSVHNLLDRLARIFRSQQPDTTLNSGVLEHIVLGAPSKLRSLAETMASNPSFLDAADLFSRVGRSARVLLKFITDQGQAKASRFQSWLRYAGTRIENVASGTTVGDRVVAVMLGYSTATLLLAGYLVSGVDRTRSHVVGQALLRVLRQLCIIVKVGSFIFVELMIFPAVCGVLLDLTTLSAVPDATLASVKERFRSNPFTMTLLTWLAGTCFMFVFAMLVSACRENLRQGVCWWIRDPGDPRYHPIRDIIARPTVSQIKKITASASMYGAVIVLGVGAILGTLQTFGGLLPLRLHFDRPWTRTGVDLVLFQNLMPLVLDILEPRQRLRQALDIASRKCAHALRLSSFLYGDRDSSEEHSSPLPAWYSSLRGASDNSTEERRMTVILNDRYGTYMRVPASDTVHFVPGRKMHIPVTEEGVPLHLPDLSIIRQQQREARAEPGASPTEDNYTICFIPTSFRTRIVVWVASMWAISVIAVAVAIGVPLFAGRAILDALWTEEQHDVYAFAAGSIVLGLLAGVAAGAWQAWRHVSAWSASASLAQVKNAVIRQRNVSIALRWAADVTEFSIGIVVGGLGAPILASLSVELYVLAPLRTKTAPLPTIYLADTWSSGLMYLALVIRIICMHRLVRLPEAIRTAWSNGHVRKAVRMANRQILLPVTAALAFAVFGPAAALGPIILLMPHSLLAPIIRRAGWEALSSADHFFLLLKSLYPALPGWYSHYITSRLIAKMVNQWLGKVRDRTFLDYRRLRNYEAAAATHAANQ